MSYFYARIDAQRRAFGVTQTASELEGQDLIELEYFDDSVLGKVHNQDTGLWDNAPVVPQTRHISVGAFFDRFGSAKWGILADTTPTVAAVVKDASVRRYIDLDNPDLPAGIALIQQAGHDIDPAAIINAPVQDSERP